jgi:hypothetical protein
MRPHGETLLYPFTAATAILTGVRWWHRYYSLAGACCLAGEDLAETVPSSVLERFIQASLGAGSVWQIAALTVGLGCRSMTHVADLQIFEIDDIIGADQGKRRFMVKVLTLTPCGLVFFGEQYHCFLAALAALLPTCYPSLRFRQLTLGPAIVPRIFDAVALGCHEKDFQSVCMWTPFQSGVN